MAGVISASTRLPVLIVRKERSRPAETSRVSFPSVLVESETAAMWLPCVRLDGKSCCGLLDFRKAGSLARSVRTLAGERWADANTYPFP